jgi:hypothetical protein
MTKSTTTSTALQARELLQRLGVAPALITEGTLVVVLFVMSSLRFVDGAWRVKARAYAMLSTWRLCW